MPRLMADVFKAMLVQKYRNMHPHARKQKRQKSIVPVYPLAIERQYENAIKELAIKPLISAFWPLLTEENYNRWLNDYSRHDASDYRQDAYENEINKIIGTLEITDDSIFDSPLPVKDAIQKAVVGTYLHSKGQWKNEMQQYVGVPFSTDEAWWAKTRGAWVNENLSLIKSQAPDVTKKIGQVLYEGVRKGTPYADIKKQLTDITGFTAGGEDTKKGLSAKASLIARDQIGKLQGQITHYRQTEIGIEKYQWVALGDERECELCGLLNGKVCRWDDSSVWSEDGGKTWVVRPADLLGLEPGSAHPQCFLGQTPVRSLVPAEKLYRRRYTGEGTTFIFDNGESFTCTPNHPILRADGQMIAAQFLNVGDKISNVSGEIILPFENNPENRIPSFEELFGFCSVVFGNEGISGTSGDFHGDGMVDQQVDIIDLESPLGNNIFCEKHAILLQKFFTEADIRLSYLVPDCKFMSMFNTLGFSPCSAMSLISKLFQFSSGHFAETDDICFRTSSDLNSIFNQHFPNGITIKSVFFGKGKDIFTPQKLFDKQFFRELFFIMRRAGMVNNRQPQLPEPFCKLVSVNAESSGQLADIASGFHLPMQIKDKIIVELDTHVYNLQNSLGWYIITQSGIIASNCRCQAIAVMDDILDDAKEEVDNAETIQEMQEPPVIGTINSNGDYVTRALAESKIQEAIIQNEDYIGSNLGFSNWFGKSKVLGKEGFPLVVFHGSPSGGFTEFDLENDKIGAAAVQRKGTAFFTNSLQNAKVYSMAGEDIVEKALPYYTLNDVEPFVQFFDQKNKVWFDKKLSDIMDSKIPKNARFWWRAKDGTDIANSDVPYINGIEKAKKRVLDFLVREPYGNPGVLGYTKNSTVSSVFLKIENPLIIDNNGKGFQNIGKLIDEAKANGNDGLIINNIKDIAGYGEKNTTTYVIFKPEQVKSVKAKKFNLKSKSIMDSADIISNPETPVEQNNTLPALPLLDTELDDEILLQAIAFTNKGIKINTDYDVPYFAGMSTDLKTCYIDRHLPQYDQQGARKLDRYFFLCFHEVDEHTREKAMPKMIYQYSHQFTSQLERLGVIAAGFDYDDYEKGLQPYIKYSWHEQLTKLPPDLILKPYKDENDMYVLKEMQAAQKKGKNNVKGSPRIVSGDNKG